MLELELPFPPSINHYYRRVGNRTLISREGRKFRALVCSTLASLGVQPMSGPLDVRVEVYPPDCRRRDVDNIQKALLDALEHGGAYHDDSQIVRLCTEKRDPVAGGLALVRLREMSNKATSLARDQA